MTFKELIMKHSWDEIRQPLIDLYYGPDKIQNHYDDGEKLIRTEEEMKTYVDKTMEGYELVFNILKIKRPRKIDNKPWKIIIKYHDYDTFLNKPEEYPYWNVNGENGDTWETDSHSKQYYDEKVKNGTVTEEDTNNIKCLISWAIEFRTWSNWLAMEVDEESLNKCGEVNFIVHCLWEMTFMGYVDKAIQNKKNKIMNDIEKTKEALDNGTLKTITLEELKEKFKTSNNN